jgi:hypothetical protein
MAGWQLKETTTTSHVVLEAPHTPAAGHMGMVRLPRKKNCAPALISDLDLVASR